MSLAIQDHLQSPVCAVYFKDYQFLDDHLTFAQKRVHNTFLMISKEIDKKMFSVSRQTLSRRTGLGIATISRAIKRLDELNCIYVKHVKKNGRNKCSIYVVFELHEIKFPNLQVNDNKPSEDIEEKVLANHFDTPNKRYLITSTEVIPMKEKEKKAPPIEQNCDEPGKGFPKKKKVSGGAKVRSEFAPLDPDRKLTTEDRQYAKTARGWNDHTIDCVYNKFVTFNVKHAYPRSDWSPIWRSWVDRELLGPIFDPSNDFGDEPLHQNTERSPKLFAANKSNAPYTHPKPFVSEVSRPIVTPKPGVPFWEDPFYKKPGRTLEKNPDGTYKMDD